jgi:hypothetical protein
MEYVLQSALYALGNKEGRDRRPRAHQELAHPRLAEFMLENADLIRLGLLAELVQPGRIAGGLTPEDRE